MSRLRLLMEASWPLRVATTLPVSGEECVAMVALNPPLNAMLTYVKASDGVVRECG